MNWRFLEAAFFFLFIKAHGGAAEALQRLFSYDVGKIRVGYGEDGW
jgi:hypothetical protein